MILAEIYNQLNQDVRGEFTRAVNRDDAALRYAHLPRYRRIPQFGDFRRQAKKVVAK